MTLDAALIDVLACPGCKQHITYQAEPEQLICTTCQLAFKVEDGIPILLMDEAIELADETAN